jgi:hypothetical protein
VVIKLKRRRRRRKQQQKIEKHEAAEIHRRNVLKKHIRTTDKLCACAVDIVIDVVVVAVGRGGDRAVAAATDRAMIPRNPSRVGQLALPVFRAVLPQCLGDALHPRLRHFLALHDKEARLGRLPQSQSISSLINFQRKKHAR